MNMREYYVNGLWKERNSLSKLDRITAWRSISYCCHNLTTFALSPRKLVECGLFLFSNTAVSIVILFCVIILWSVGTNFAWNDVTQHTDDFAATSPIWHVIVIEIFYSPAHCKHYSLIFPLTIHYGHLDPYPSCLEIFLFYE